MGLDYRYLLFFERATHLAALERLGAIAFPRADGQTELVLPDRTVTLPFSGWLRTEPRIAWDDPSPSWDFMTVLCFEPDEAIEDYLDDPDQHDAQGRATIGIVYLTVQRDMTRWPTGNDEDLVVFDLNTPGTHMSILFTESDSIRRAFADLLASSGGVYGVLDQEDYADLFWLRGREVEVRLPAADLPLAEIDRLVAASRFGELAGQATEVVMAARELQSAARGSLGVHHWLLALLDSGVPLTGDLARVDRDAAKAELRQRLASGAAGAELSEDEVVRRAAARARRTGDGQVTTEDLAHVVADAAVSVSL